MSGATPPPPRHRRRPIASEPFIPIDSINVVGLFGKYDYPGIQIFDPVREYPTVSFLYGENGVGKSTILRLLYSMLSPRDNEGHRGLLAKEKFKEISVKFTDGQKVEISRSKSNIGSYQYILDGPRSSGRFSINAEFGRVQKNDDVDSLIACLKKIDNTLVFVNDNRTIRSNYAPWDVRGYLDGMLSNSLPGRRLYSDGEIVYPDGPIIDSLAAAGLERLLQQAYKLLVESALEGTVRANVGTGQVYLEVARAISRSKIRERSFVDFDINNLMQRVTSIRKNIDDYGKYGLFQGEYLDDIFKIVLKSGPRVQPQIIEVVEPYIASLESRIKSNLALMEQMSAFEEGVNRFLKRKKMVLQINDRIHFADDGGNKISAAELSSGERHLLYICSAALLSRQKPSIIFVDEPELSLNYKWQRSLIDALVNIAGGKAQFIMATHSFEIISRYRDGAVELDPK